MLNRITRRGSTLLEDAMEMACTGWISARGHMARGRDSWATTVPQETRPPEAGGPTHCEPAPLSLEQRIAALEAENRRLWATVDMLLRRLLGD